MRDRNRGRWGITRHITRSDDSFLFLQEFQVLWSAMLAELRPVEIKKISVVFSDLAEEQGAMDLYTRLKELRRAGVLATLDSLNRKW